MDLETWVLIQQQDWCSINEDTRELNIDKPDVNDKLVRRVKAS